MLSWLASHPRRHGFFNFSNMMSILLTLGLYRETFFHSTYCIKHSYTDLCVYFLCISTFPPGVTSTRSGALFCSSLHTWNHGDLNPVFKKNFVKVSFLLLGYYLFAQCLTHIYCASSVNTDMDSRYAVRNKTELLTSWKLPLGGRWIYRGSRHTNLCMSV